MFLLSGPDASKNEIETLMASVNTLEREKREHVESKQVELSIV